MLASVKAVECFILCSVRIFDWFRNTLTVANEREKTDLDVRHATLSRGNDNSRSYS